jgi:hypothetical protein
LHPILIECYITDINHELEFRISLDGSEFRLTAGYTVKIEARVVEAPAARGEIQPDAA